MRNDIHRPSVIDPADYEFVAQEHIKLDGFGDAEIVLANREAIRNHMARTGGQYASVETTGNCMVCGSVNAIYTSLFYHAKSNSYVRMGTDCTENVFHSDFGAKAFRASVQDAREAHAGKRKAQAILGDADLSSAYELYASEWKGYKTTENPDGDTRDHQTVRDMVGKLVQYGSISEKATNFLRILMTRIANAPTIAAKRAEEKALAADCPSGRVQVTGIVLSTKEVESQFGWVTKMLVKDDRGFTVWGSRPSGLDACKGDRVSFFAAIEVAQGDPKHGFYKRPTKAVMLTAKPDSYDPSHNDGIGF